MNLGHAIKKLRTSKSIAQGDLATIVGISQTSLSQIEKGTKRPSAKNMKKISSALNIPEAVIYLYSLEEADIPDRKKDMFNDLFPAIQNMIEKITVEKDI